MDIRCHSPLSGRLSSKKGDGEGSVSEGCDASAKEQLDSSLPGCKCQRQVTSNHYIWEEMLWLWCGQPQEKVERLLKRRSFPFMTNTKRYTIIAHNGQPNYGSVRGRLNQGQEHGNGKGCKEVSASCCQHCMRSCGLLDRLASWGRKSQQWQRVSSTATSRRRSTNWWIHHHGLWQHQHKGGSTVCWLRRGWPLDMWTETSGIVFFLSWNTPPTRKMEVPGLILIVQVNPKPITQGWHVFPTLVNTGR